MEIRRRGVSSLRRSLSLSLLVHAFFLLVCAILLRWRAAEPPVKQWTLIELENTPPQQARKKEETRPNKRIVQTAPGHITHKAAPDAFLGEHNQTVDRQTVSKDHEIAMGRNKAEKRASPEPSRAKKMAQR